MRGTITYWNTASGNGFVHICKRYMHLQITARGAMHYPNRRKVLVPMDTRSVPPQVGDEIEVPIVIRRTVHDHSGRDPQYYEALFWYPVKK